MKWSHARDSRPTLMLTRQLHRCLCLHGMEPSVGNAPTPELYESPARLSTLGWQNGSPPRIRTENARTSTGGLSAGRYKLRVFLLN